MLAPARGKGRIEITPEYVTRGRLGITETFRMARIKTRFPFLIPATEYLQKRGYLIVEPTHG